MKKKLPLVNDLLKTVYFYSKKTFVPLLREKDYNSLFGHFVYQHIYRCHAAYALLYGSVKENGYPKR